ncbi:MAG: hypothetical protein NZ555_16865, partial [Geminicoccaceae bacterium]|nr:hypothetical protein [Geminicoccaceae bacterium]
MATALAERRRAEPDLLAACRAGLAAAASVRDRAREKLAARAERLRDAGRLGERERLQLAWGFSEYLARLSGGWPMA